MICRKPEVAYRTFFPPHARISQTASLKGSEVISQTLCPDWLAWVGIVCRGKKTKTKTINKRVKKKKTLATEFGGFSPDVLTQVLNTPRTVGTVSRGTASVDPGGGADPLSDSLRPYQHVSGKNY